MAKQYTQTGARRAEPLEPELITVHILDKDDEGKDKIVVTSCTQYVNVEKDDKHVDGTIVKNTDRLGKYIRCRVRFNVEGCHKFKIKLVPDPDNASYSGDEKDRNPNFKYKGEEEEEEKSYTTDSDGTKIVEDLFLSAAGGNSFRVSATDDKETITTAGTVKTMRLMYYVEVKMKGLTNCTDSLDILKRKYLEHGIILRGLPEAENIEYIGNVGEDNAFFIAAVNEAYKKSEGPSMEPHCIAIAYVDQMAVMDHNKEVTVDNIQLGSSTPIWIDIMDGDNNNRIRILWSNLASGGDDWFVDCSFVPNGTLNDADHRGSNNRITIPKSKFTLPNSSGENTFVKLDVSDFPEETGTLFLRVNWVRNMRRGISRIDADTNLIAIATRIQWHEVPSAQQNRTMIHEVGHQLRMVTDGTGELPAKVPTHYTGKGHIGNHCHAGLPEMNSYSSQTGECVMFGSASEVDFCDDCSKAVKKLDLSKGVKRPTLSKGGTQ